MAQLKSYMSACPNAEWGMWTNSKEKFVFKKFTDDKGVIQFMDYNDIPSADGNIDDINRPKRASLKNASDDNLLFTFKTCHNHIYVNEGMQKQPAFFELLKVIFCKIEDERNLMLENVSNELEKLEKEISLNDVNKMNNNNIQNMNLYIFMDKGKAISDTLSRSFKIVNLLKEIEKLKLSISNININNGEVVINDLKNPQNLNGYISQNNLKALISKKDGDYQISSHENDLLIKTLYSDKKIDLIIEYLKNNLIPGKAIKLVSEVVSENNSFKNLNNTVLTDEEKQLLMQKMESLKTNDYNQLMTKYAEQTKTIENLIENVNVKISKLDALKKDLLSLDKIVTLEPQNNEQNKNNSLSNSENINNQTNENNQTDKKNNLNSQIQN